MAVVLFTELGPLGPRQSAYSVSSIHRVPRFGRAADGWRGPVKPSRPSLEWLFLFYFFKFVMINVDNKGACTNHVDSKWGGGVGPNDHVCLCRGEGGLEQCLCGLFPL